MSEKPQPEPKPRLRWCQYSLRSLFLVTLALALWLGWICYKANQRRRAVEAIEELGGSVLYDYQVDTDGFPIPNATPPGPAWFRNLVGVDFLADVINVSLWDPEVYIQPVTDVDLIHLKRLDEVKFVCLYETRITDAGLEHLMGLTRLEWLNLSETQISDAGLVYLRGMTELDDLNLRGTQVTDAGLVHLKELADLGELDLKKTQVTNKGVKQLQQALPDCIIYH